MTQVLSELSSVAQLGNDDAGLKFTAIAHVFIFIFLFCYSNLFTMRGEEVIFQNMLLHFVLI